MVPGLVEKVSFAIQPNRRLASAVPSLHLVVGDMGRSALMDRGLRLFRWVLRRQMRQEADHHILVGQLSR